MFKRFLLIVLALLLPVILLFTVYRASVGLGPLQFSSILSLLGNSFDDTSNRLQDVFVAFSEASDGLFMIAHVEPFSDGTLNFIYKLFYSFVSFLDGDRILACLLWFVRVIWLILKVFIAVVQDISDLFRILGFFLIGGSPYEVLPYFPVGG